MFGRLSSKYLHTVDRKFSLMHGRHTVDVHGRIRALQINNLAQNGGSW